jgi:hypothetical protein
VFQSEHSAECSNRNIVLNVPTGTFCAGKNIGTAVYVQSSLSEAGH